MEDLQLLLNKLTQAVSYKYKGGCAPGVTISYLPNKQYYVSILKYGRDHLDKRVMHSAKSESLADALDNVTNQFLRAQAVDKNPVDELRDLVEDGPDDEDPDMI